MPKSRPAKSKLSRPKMPGYKSKKGPNWIVYGEHPKHGSYASHFKTRGEANTFLRKAKSEKHKRVEVRRITYSGSPQ